jgi:hypothetical protein
MGQAGDRIYGVGIGWTEWTGFAGFAGLTGLGLRAPEIYKMIRMTEWTGWTGLTGLGLRAPEMDEMDGIFRMNKIEWGMAFGINTRKLRKFFSFCQNFRSK